ncbi:MAG: hypothetical protein SV375_09420, partial [Thermodesulfobacteriota bacterium]|nr:hypothetical protein [Thermodesulfobacteriota bacterium]
MGGVSLDHDPPGALAYYAKIQKIKRRFMMMKLKMVGFVGLAFIILFYVSILMMPAGVEAQSKVVAIEGISYNVSASMG